MKNTMKTKYRCGWCGHPTDKDGNYIKADIDESQETVLTNGDCEKQREYERELIEYERMINDSSQDKT